MDFQYPRAAPESKPTPMHIYAFLVCSRPQISEYFRGGGVEPDKPGTITRAINAIGSEATAAGAEAIARVVDELGHVATSLLRGHTGHQDLEPAALVNEVFARMLKRGGQWANREHFYATAAVAMRHFLVDQARRRQAAKRGGGIPGRPVPGGVAASAAMDPADLIQLDAALHELSRLDGRVCEVVMLRFFAGRSTEEAATLLGISVRTVQRDWDFARAWLYKKMSGDLAAPVRVTGDDK